VLRMFVQRALIESDEYRERVEPPGVHRAIAASFTLNAQDPCARSWLSVRLGKMELRAADRRLPPGHWLPPGGRACHLNPGFASRRSHHPGNADAPRVGLP